MGSLIWKQSKTILYEVKDKSAQQMVEHVYQKLSDLQNYQLNDDFTIVIFKKESKTGLNFCVAGIKSRSVLYNQHKTREVGVQK